MRAFLKQTRNLSSTFFLPSCSSSSSGLLTVRLRCSLVRVPEEQLRPYHKFFTSMPENTVKDPSSAYLDSYRTRGVVKLMGYNK